jgi:hypothetical protein
MSLPRFAPLLNRLDLHSRAYRTAVCVAWADAIAQLSMATFIRCWDSAEKAISLHFAQDMDKLMQIPASPKPVPADAASDIPQARSLAQAQRFIYPSFSQGDPRHISRNKELRPLVCAHLFVRLGTPRRLTVAHVFCRTGTRAWNCGNINIVHRRSSFTGIRNSHSRATSGQASYRRFGHSSVTAP